MTFCSCSSDDAFNYNDFKKSTKDRVYAIYNQMPLMNVDGVWWEQKYDVYEESFAPTGCFWFKDDMTYIDYWFDKDGTEERQAWGDYSMKELYHSPIPGAVTYDIKKHFYWIWQAISLQINSQTQRMSTLENVFRNENQGFVNYVLEEASNEKIVIRGEFSTPYSFLHYGETLLFDGFRFYYYLYSQPEHNEFFYNREDADEFVKEILNRNKE